MTNPKLARLFLAKMNSQSPSPPQTPPPSPPQSPPPSPTQSPSPAEPSQLLSAPQARPPRRQRNAPCDTVPYWMPSGIEGKLLPPLVRHEIVTMLTPIYHELVLSAKPGLAQSTGITIVHLLWLEILDQVELGNQAMSPPVKLDPLNVLNVETRPRMIERHLRLIHSKLQASDLLLRIEKLKLRSRAHRKSAQPAPRQLSTTRRRRPKPGKNDFC